MDIRDQLYRYHNLHEVPGNNKLKNSKKTRYNTAEGELTASFGNNTVGVEEANKTSRHNQNEGILGSLGVVGALGVVVALGDPEEEEAL